MAVECKASTSPQLTKGFRRALGIISPAQTFVISPVEGSYPIRDNVTVCGLDYFSGLGILD